MKKVTWEDLVRLVEGYREYFKGQKKSPRELPSDSTPTTRDAALCHAAWMLTMPWSTFDRLTFDEVLYTIGLIQGFLFVTEDFTLEELRKHLETGVVRKKYDSEHAAQLSGC